MKKALFLFLISMAYPSFATEILSAHSGSYRCQCLHEACKNKRPNDVHLKVDSNANRLEIDYGDEIQSGAPSRSVTPDGAVTYFLASRGNVSFTKDAEMKFGWGKLWTCHRL